MLGLRQVPAVRSGQRALGGGLIGAGPVLLSALRQEGVGGGGGGLGTGASDRRVARSGRIADEGITPALMDGCP